MRSSSDPDTPKDKKARSTHDHLEMKAKSHAWNSFSHSNLGRHHLNDSQLFNSGMCVHMLRDAQLRESAAGDVTPATPSHKESIFQRAISQPTSKAHKYGASTSSSSVFEATHLLEDDDKHSAPVSPTNGGDALKCATCAHSLALYKTRHSLAHRHRSSGPGQCCDAGPTAEHIHSSSICFRGHGPPNSKPDNMRTADMLAILNKL
jgi:hypothetical protein